MLLILRPEDVSDAELDALNEAIDRMERGQLRSFLTHVHNELAAGNPVVITTKEIVT